MSTTAETLKLDRNLVNHAFASWRLGRPIVLSEEVMELPGQVYVVPSGDIDYAHMRASALHNALIASGQRLYVLLEGLGGITVYHVVTAGDRAPRLDKVAGPLNPQASNEEAAVEAPLHGSVAEVWGSSGEQDTLLFLSRGQGDLQAVVVGGQEGAMEKGATVSAPIFPLRPPSPLVGVRPFVLEAAYWTLDGEVRAVVWALSAARAGARGGCEVHLLTLTYAPAKGDVPAGLAVKNVQLLKRCVISPLAVAVDARSDVVVVGVEPSTHEEEEEKEEEATGGPLARTSSGGGAEASGSGGDVDPRTLEQAVAHLAAYSSEEGGGAQSGPQRNEWADLYNEDDAEVAAEPTCTLYAFQAGAEGERLQPLSSLSCSPHKLLAASGSGGRTVLGLSDDVDCALVEVSPGAQCAGSAGGGPGLSARHADNIPALAYVVAGKPQRKYLLLGARQGVVAAALVEGHGMAYLYRPVPKGGKYGEQQVVSLGDGDASSVLGAQLVGSRRGASMLLLLTSRQLLVFRI